MRGKLFILLIMVGIPIMTWVILAWVIMIVLGALHALCSAIPALGFWASLFVTVMVFAIIVFVVSMATKNARLARYRDGR